MEPNNQPDSNRPRYWFPAKRYGWGWGVPATWQGWLVLILWIVLFTVGAFILAGRHWLAFFVFEIGMVGLIIAICFAKGEPPRWRWGK
jgi:hypothetical protein